MQKYMYDRKKKKRKWKSRGSGKGEREKKAGQPNKKEVGDQDGLLYFCTTTKVFFPETCAGARERVCLTNAKRDRLDVRPSSLLQ